jgi:hypothetical protein
MTAIITSGFWGKRLEVNAQHAIFHQWDQLEASGCIENFRIAAGDVQGLREGWFFADSDAYKWLDAAARICACAPEPRLVALMDDFIALLGRAQQPDGYLFTYNQIHFPGVRWQNLQIEHELYCHGHLIEAGVSHAETTGQDGLLYIARRAADCIVANFKGKGPRHTPGHEEIEIALLRLYQHTGHPPYLDLARQFIEQRGRDPFFALSILRQNASVEKRGRQVRQEKQAYMAAHPEFKPFELPPGNAAKKPRDATRRWQLSALTGKYFQQHAPIRRQTVPVGHAVRFAYLQTAATMLARLTADTSLLPSLRQAWERMITRRMYLTGGIGSLPGIEGFGNDYELDPEYAYAETCAALASIFWNWEMAHLTGQAWYSDLLEWQFYNAAAVGMSLDGTRYLYNNPLACHGGITRKAWYAVPCCPSNLSRTWASLGHYILSTQPAELFIHQFISSQHTTGLTSLEIQSGLPWSGQIMIILNPAVPARFAVSVRIPSWCADAPAADLVVTAAGKRLVVPPPPAAPDQTASGYDPRLGQWLRIDRIWQPGDRIELSLPMPIQVRHAHPRLRDHQGKIAITRGPLVYCLENLDNPGTDIFSTRLVPQTLETAWDDSLLDGIVKLTGRSQDGRLLTLIPYMLWGNRDESTMTVWMNA